MAMRSQSKYENTILYLCKELGGSVYGKKKLAKLLYYVDFDRYEFHEAMKSVTGDKYKAWKMGPVPEKYMTVVKKLKTEKKINQESEEMPGYNHPTEIFTAKSEPDMSVFNKEDIQILDHVISKYGKLTGKQLEDLTHQEAPYVGTEPDKEIAFELAFYRETDFSDVMANA